MIPGVDFDAVASRHLDHDHVAVGVSEYGDDTADVCGICGFAVGFADVRPERQMHAVPTDSGPTIKVVREDPPERGRGSSIGTRMGPALAEVRGEPGVWFRVATFPGKTGANAAQTSCKKAHPGYSFAARRLEEGSALWARFDA